MREKWETEQAARARAERDEATRDRIAYAAEIIARITVEAPPSGVRALHRAGKLGMRDAMRAGLTRGEAQAAGFR